MLMEISRIRNNLLFCGASFCGVYVCVCGWLVLVCLVYVVFWHVSRCFTGLKLNLVQWVQSCKFGLKSNDMGNVTEQQLHAECFKWFHNTYPMERGMLHHNNNNSVNQIAGNKMKAMGVIAGVSDFELILPRGTVAFIEMKTETGVLSEDQKRFCAMVISRGHVYFVVRTLPKFQELIKTLLNG
jgi:VRR-NUC domain